MKFIETIFLFTLLVCTNLRAMEENLDPNILDITKQLQKLSLKKKPLSQAEIKDILAILSLRSEVIHCMIERCKVETSTQDFSELSFQKLNRSKKALLTTFYEAEIYYSESSEKTRTIIDCIDKTVRSKVINIYDYNFIKPIINNNILLNENKNLQMFLNIGNTIFQKKKLFLESSRNTVSIQYKTRLAKVYEKYYKELAVKKDVAQSIFETELWLSKLSQKEQNNLFNILFNIHVLHLHNLIRAEVDKKTSAIVRSSESRLKKKLLQKEFAAIRAVLKKRPSTTIELEIEKISSLSLPAKIVDVFTQMLSTKESISETPSYLVYLKYLYNNNEKLVPKNLLQQHSQKTVSLIIKHASLLELLLSAIPNSHEKIKNLFAQQEKPNPAKTQNKTTTQNKKRNRKRKKRRCPQSVAMKRDLTELKPNTTKEDNHLTRNAAKKTNRKRNRRRKKKKSGTTTPQTKNNQPPIKTLEDTNVADKRDKVPTPQSNKLPKQKDSEAYLEQFYINPSSDIIHRETDKYACILDLIRKDFEGNQNKIFIIKSSELLPYNPLKDIVYSKYVLANKMSNENDNNHAFSPLVRQFGQHAYIKDQLLTDIQKKALGTKHHIQNSRQYTLQHTVYLPARIASLGYPVEHFEAIGCTANGEFEFTVVKKSTDDHGVCIHRFFRPYN